MAAQEPIRADPLAAPDAAYDIGPLPGGDILFRALHDPGAPSSPAPAPAPVAIAPAEPVSIPPTGPSPAGPPPPAWQPPPQAWRPPPQAWQPPPVRAPQPWAGRASNPLRRRLAPTLAILVALLAFALSMLTSRSQSGPTSPVSAPAPGPAPGGTHLVVLEVTGTGVDRAYVDATVPGTRGAHPRGPVPLPWSQGIETGESGWTSLITTAASSSATITCRITIDGQVVAEESAGSSVGCRYDSSSE